MSEIAKLYKNAGLSNMWVERYNDGYYEHENYYDSYKEMINNMMKANDWTLTEAQETAKREYSKELPPFTAEKQINLILFLANREIRISPTYISSGYYLNNIHKIKSSRNISTFEESLAQHINAIWQDLTEEERKQIKNILQEVE